MPQTALFLQALGDQVVRPLRRWQNRIIAHRSRLGTRPRVTEELPEPVLVGDADLGTSMVAGTWNAMGHEIDISGKPIWELRLPDKRLESARHSFLWLDHLAALGNRVARERAQDWTQDWIKRYGNGRGPGWRPEQTGRRVKRWTVHSALLTKDLDHEASDRFWRALAAQQRYLSNTWTRAPGGLPRMRALAGLVWSGLVLPHTRHHATVAELGLYASELIDEKGELASRRPDHLAEIVILLIWTARLLENAGQHAPAAHLSAIVRAVPVLRQLRLGDGALAAFNGGGTGESASLDKALAELRIGVQEKPKLAMGYARLSGGRIAVVMDADEPALGQYAKRANAGTLSFEMSVHRQRVIVNAGPGQMFGREWEAVSRQTAAHSTVEVGNKSSARIVTGGLVARAFGSQLEGGPSLVSIRQAQDATGQWLLATHDGYVASHGVLHERRMFIDMRGSELRGEDILSVPDARAKAQHDSAASRGPVQFAARFHLHPAVAAERDAGRDVVTLTLPSGEQWAFRATGGQIGLEEAVYFDRFAAAPLATRQVVVRAEVVEYLGQVIWSIGRIPVPQAKHEAVA